MKKTLFFAMLFLMGAAFSHAETHKASAHWSYEGKEGPVFWGSLDPAYEMCSKGRNQSPIDLKGFIEAELPAIPFVDNGAWSQILNNGHTIQVNVNEGSTIEIDGITFSLLQFHFHSPSENLIDGRSFPLEAHFVHKDKNGNLAVVALMFKYGPENRVLERLWAVMPEKAGEKVAIEPAFKPYDLLPKNRDYFRFNGSLTTPPCSEGVRWIVLKDFATVSKEQVDKFKHVMHHPNNRPVQPINARTVLK